MNFFPDQANKSLIMSGLQMTIYIYIYIEKSLAGILLTFKVNLGFNRFDS